MSSISSDKTNKIIEFGYGCLIEYKLKLVMKVALHIYLQYVFFLVRSALCILLKVPVSLKICNFSYLVAQNIFYNTFRCNTVF